MESGIQYNTRSSHNPLLVPKKKREKLMIRRAKSGEPQSKRELDRAATEEKEFKDDDLLYNEEPSNKK